MSWLWLHYLYAFILTSLLWCSVNLQSCADSTTQFPIEIGFYHNGTTSDIYASRDIHVDSNLTKYLLYSPDDTYQNVHLTKILSNGTYEWSKEYPGLFILPDFQMTQMSNDESNIKLIGSSSSGAGQMAQISTADGTLSTAIQFSRSLEITSSSFNSQLKCSKTTDSMCFFIGRTSSDATDHRVWKFDFDAPTIVNITDPDNANFKLQTIDALDDDNFLIAGFDTGSSPHKHIFYSANISSTTVNWGTQMDALEDIFASTAKARLYSYINNANTK